MNDILDDIIAHKRAEIDNLKRQLPPSVFYRRAESEVCNCQYTPSMKTSLLESPTGIIAEFKRRSPSVGWIREDGRADIIPLGYQQNGASAISVSTDEKYFRGCDEFIGEALGSGVTLPILYNNFIIDEYQLFKARFSGASAVLLIASCLTVGDCRNLIRRAHELKMEVLLEMHSEEELHYAELDPDMYGISNCNLSTLVADVENSFRLAEKLPLAGCKFSGGGISDADTIRRLREVGFRGFLIGGHFMKADDPGAALHSLIKELC